MTTESRADRFRPSEEEAERLLKRGFIRVPLDVPFQVDPVNLIIFVGDAPVLLDAGIRHLDNEARVRDALASRGWTTKDVAEVWLTHPHIDHFGLGGSIVKEAGATLHAWERAVTRFEEYPSFWEEDRNSFLEMLAYSGVKEEAMAAVRKISSHFQRRATPLSIDSPFSIGNTVIFAGNQRVVPIHSPGHSPWCTAYWFEEQKVLVGGDVLLERITPNPLYYPKEASPSEWQGLRAYRDSLSFLATLPIDIVIPGHGASFGGHEEVIERALRHQLRRSNRLLERLGSDTLSLYEWALRLFGERLTHSSLFLVMSEAYRHMEWLLEEGLIERKEDGYGRWCLTRRKDNE